MYTTFYILFLNIKRVLLKEPYIFLSYPCITHKVLWSIKLLASGTKTIVHFSKNVLFYTDILFFHHLRNCTYLFLCSTSQSFGSLDIKNNTLNFVFYHLFLFKLTASLLYWNLFNPENYVFYVNKTQINSTKQIIFNILRFIFYKFIYYSSEKTFFIRH